MRSQTDYIVTKDEVHRYANDWLSLSLKLEYKGTKCTASTLIQILLIAATRVASIFAVCRDLADAPCDQTIRDALAKSLPEIAELERRLNRSLCTKLPKALFRKSRKIAIDLTLIPYHGQPLHDKKEIYRSAPKAGTTHFHAYATAAVIHKGHRYTLALTHVEYGEKMKPIVQRRLAIIRRRKVKVRFLLLDKGFFSVEVISYLKHAQLGFIIPAMARGRVCDCCLSASRWCCEMFGCGCTSNSPKENGMRSPSCFLNCSAFAKCYSGSAKSSDACSEQIKVKASMLKPTNDLQKRVKLTELGTTEPRNWQG